MTDVRREMDRLEKKGLVQHCGITPTDFLHAKGTFAAWNRETALLALQILCDRHRISLPALSEKLAEVMERKMGLQILDLVLAEQVRLHRDQDGCDVCSVFWDQCFSREKRSDHVQFQISLKNRLVGIGAPAHAFLPPVAQKLGTSVIVPFHAGVANAIGAITGAVAITDEALIRPVQVSSGSIPLTGLKSLPAWRKRRSGEEISLQRSSGKRPERRAPETWR
ncbi:MAG: hypothetical protein AABZ85_04815 [Thermodesulfobacteriota bacterium]